MAKYRGTGKVTDADFKQVKYVGKTKGGQAVTIILNDAINLGNIDWSMVEKDDTVAKAEFTATYSNTNAPANSTEEPWEVEVAGTPSGAESIMLGVGIFYIGETEVGLTRGGGQFVVEREYRNINADGDRGPVKGRIEMDGSVAKMTINSLQITNKITDLYPAVTTVNG